MRVALAEIGLAVMGAESGQIIGQRQGVGMRPRNEAEREQRAGEPSHHIGIRSIGSAQGWRPNRAAATDAHAWSLIAIEFG